ncbi:MAG: hypothetical protein LC739_03905 [Actinobacteria bacterium]|nr:hypothetical protein [Actinomycetota bacterium]
MEALIILEGIVIVLLVVLVAGLLRSHAEILRQLDSLGAGEHHETFLASPRRQSSLGAIGARALHGVTPLGASVSLALADARGHTLLAFLSSTCASCGAFWNGSRQLGLEGVRPVIVTKGVESESPAEIARLAGAELLTIMSTEAWEEFRVPATPYFALVDNGSGRVVGGGSAPDWDRVEDMVRRAIADAGLHRSTAQRKADVDEELADAGFEPGDARLYERPETP